MTERALKTVAWFTYGVNPRNFWSSIAVAVVIDDFKESAGHE